MAETLLQKAQRLNIKPAGTPTASSGSPAGETLLQKAERLNIKPAGTPAPKDPGIFNTGTLKGETSYPAKEGGAGTIPGNVGRTLGNIPSSAAKLVRNVIAPINPLDTDSPINIGANIVKGSEAAYNLIKERGFNAPLDFAKGGLEVGKNIAKKVYEVGKEAVTHPVDTATKISKVGIEDPLLVPSLLVGGEEALGGKADDLISKVASPITRGVDTSLPKLAQTLTRQSESAIENTVLKKFNKGVKPLLPGKTTLADYNDDVITAIKTIKENGPNLEFTDDLGEIVKGKLPTSLKELDDSVQQTKRTVFSKYDSLAKQAGEAGITVDSVPIANELDAVIGNKALAITNPKAIEYAEKLKERLTAAGKLDTNTAQDVIKNYNKSLEAFYRNPSYDTASQAAIDALVVNRFRKALDEGITGLTGTKYQALKSQYAALKKIEKDVIKANLRDARKNTKGLIDFSDVFSGGQVVSGIIGLNPQQIAQGLTQKGITEFYKYLNNPNRAIEKMFKASEKLPPLPSLNVK